MALKANRKNKDDSCKAVTARKSSTVNAAKIWCMLGLFIGGISSLGNMPLGYKFGEVLAQSFNISISPHLLGWYFSITAAIPLGFLAGRTTAKVFKEIALIHFPKINLFSFKDNVYLREITLVTVGMLSALPFVYITHHALKPLIGPYVAIIDIPAFVAPTAVNRWALLSVIKEMAGGGFRGKRKPLRYLKNIDPMKIFGAIGFINGALSAYQYWGNGRSAAEWMHLGVGGIYIIGIAALICNGALGGYTGKVVFETCYSWVAKKIYSFGHLNKRKRGLSALFSRVQLKNFGKVILIIAIIVISVSAATPNVYLTLEQVSKHAALLKYGLIFCSFVAPLATNFYSIYSAFYNKN